METNFEKTVYLERPNTLSEFISDEERMTLTSLKITGILGSCDVLDVLDDMCTAHGTFDEYDDFTLNEEDSPKLIELDLGDCTYVGGTDLPYFGYYTQLHKIVFPKGIRCCIDNTWESGFSDSGTLSTVVFPEGIVKLDGFTNCSKIEGIVIPESVKEFGEYAFYATSISSIWLSKHIEFISGGTFAYTLIEKYEIDPLNPNFTVIDGIIFTKDRTKLIAYPPKAKVRHYAIPEGTKIIATHAFFGNSVESIALPESLETIEEYAFRSCRAKIIPTNGQPFAIFPHNEGRIRTKRDNWEPKDNE